MLILFIFWAVIFFAPPPGLYVRTQLYSVNTVPVFILITLIQPPIISWTLLCSYNAPYYTALYSYYTCIVFATLDNVTVQYVQVGGVVGAWELALYEDLD
jgi:hypothetical protein